MKVYSCAANPVAEEATIEVVLLGAISTAVEALNASLLQLTMLIT